MPRLALLLPAIVYCIAVTATATCIVTLCGYDDCCTSKDGKTAAGVYNLTAWENPHPGGSNAISRNCGQTVTNWLASGSGSHTQFKGLLEAGEDLNTFAVFKGAYDGCETATDTTAAAKATDTTTAAKGEDVDSGCEVEIWGVNENDCSAAGVYDLTDWASTHPGGAGPIKAACQSKKVTGWLANGSHKTFKTQLEGNLNMEYAGKTLPFVKKATGCDNSNNDATTTTAGQAKAGKLCFEGDTYCVSSKPKDDNAVEITLEGKAGAYVSIGIQAKGKTAMSPADTMTCVVDGNGKVIAVPGKNIGYDNSPDSDSKMKLELVSGKKENGKITCTFTRLKDSTNNPITDDDMQILWAVGDKGNAKKLEQHAYRGPGLNSKALTFNFVTGVGVAPPAEAKLPIITIIFYALLGLVSLLGLITTRAAPKNYMLLHKTVLGTTIGQWIVLLLLAIALIVILTVYVEIPVNMLGFLSITCLGFTILPTARHSPWGFIFGISFERAIKFHRWVARLSVLFTTVHFVMVLYERGNIAFSMQESGRSVPLWGTIAWIGMVIMSCFAYEAVRRKMFELFWYVHYLFFPIVLVFAFLHNPLCMGILASGAALYSLDILIREFQQCCRKFEVQEVKAMEGRVTCLTLKPPAGFTFEPGQFCFLRIPAISMFQVHPFSISSAPGASTMTFHIKNMADDQFTGELFAKAKTGSIDSVKVMGPYGSLSLPATKYKCLVLVAGGVGITPMMSIFESMKNPKVLEGGAIKKVVLVWSNRGGAPLTSWFPNIKNCLVPEQELMLYNTAKNEELVEENPVGGERVSIQRGRPAYDNILQTAMSETGASPDDTALCACGPGRMVEALENICNLRKVHFHKETFLF